jgi:signal peptidase I
MGSRIGYTDGRESVADHPVAKGVIREYTETILVCVIFLIFTRAFVFQQSKIPSGSMEDTLRIGDYIMVNRFVYAPSSFGWERALLPLREVRRGDVVVFKFPPEPEVDYIKRIVGLPGDTVELRDGHLYVNGERVEEPYVQEDYREHEFFPPQTVPPGHYFAMGDHRNRSSDSRVWGPVPRELIKGRALLVWWSYDEDPEAARRQGMDNLKGMLGKLLQFPWKSRWSRCFTIIR